MAHMIVGKVLLSYSGVVGEGKQGKTAFKFTEPEFQYSFRGHLKNFGTKNL